MGYGLNNSETLFQNQYLLITELVTATHLRLNYKRQLYSLDYTRNDLFNQFEFMVDVNFKKLKYFSNTFITNTTIINNFFCRNGLNDLTASMRVSKYIPF
jgi:hypothetical protein